MNNAKNYKNFAKYENDITLAQLDNIFWNYTDGLTDISLHYEDQGTNESYVITVPDIIDALFYVYWKHSDEISYSQLKDMYTHARINTNHANLRCCPDEFYTEAAKQVKSILNDFKQQYYGGKLNGVMFRMQDTDFAEIANRMFDKVFKITKDAIYMGNTYTAVAAYVLDWENAKYAQGFIECGTDLLSVHDFIRSTIDYEKLGQLLVTRQANHKIFKTYTGYYFIPDPMFIEEDC